MPNPGHCPDFARGKRVRVVLANGQRYGDHPVNAVVPAGWAADGSNGCRWSRSGHPFDIAEYEVIA